MREVTKEEFYKGVGNLDAVINLIGDYPYTAEYKIRGFGTVAGKVVHRYGEGDEDYEITKYYLPNT